MKLSNKDWLIEQNDFSIDGKYESCFTLTNGYMGIRGVFEENFESQTPGTYIAGIFDKSEALVSQLVNMPYFFALEIYINDQVLDLSKCKILDFYRALDLKQGLLYREMTAQDDKGRVTEIKGYGFCSLANRHLTGIHYELTPINYSARIYVKNIIDASTVNGRHTVWDAAKHYSCTKSMVKGDSPVYLEVETKEKRYSAGFASNLSITKNGTKVELRKKAVDLGDKIVQTVEFDGIQKETYSIEKYAAVMTSRDTSKDGIQKKADEELQKFLTAGMENELGKSISQLDRMWAVSDIRIEGDERAQKAIRFNVYMLSTTVNPSDDRISAAAKGLHGEGYNGHVFWDTEIFTLPFYIYNNPKAARSLLLYRYNTLNAARENARLSGYKGARYVWESADIGNEETPKWGLDYNGNRTRIWTGEIEYHITSDIAYAVWQYVRATDDIDFLLKYGAEIILETSRFWVSRVEYAKEYDRYEINDVIGPDEFHEHIDNNVYTNYMARWNIIKGIKILSMIKSQYPDEYKRLTDKLCLTDQEIETWDRIAEKIFIPAQNDDLVFEQHEGYFKLRDYIITEYDENNMPVFPREVDIVNLNNYTIIKQADIIMLLYILGEEFSKETKKNNFEYYEKRTVHKSSLSPSIYCILGLVVGDYEKSYEYLMRTALVDLDDNQGNTSQGIHFASTGGTWQAAIFGFGGVSINKDDTICFNPIWIPDNWKRYSYKICWKGCILAVDITKDSISVSMERGSKKLNVNICDEDYLLDSGKEVKRNIRFGSVLSTK